MPAETRPDPVCVLQCTREGCRGRVTGEHRAMIEQPKLGDVLPFVCPECGDRYALEYHPAPTTEFRGKRGTQKRERWVPTPRAID